MSDATRRPAEPREGTQRAEPARGSAASTARRSGSSAACSAPRAAATPPATAGSSAPYGCQARPRRPYGGWFDEVADELEGALEEQDLVPENAIEKTVVDRDELTFHITREHLVRVARTLRDDPALRFELCTGRQRRPLPGDKGRELHAVYHLRSLTHGRLIRLEVSAPDADPHIPSLVEVYPTNDWHEREAYDFFGLIFDGHPALTRIMMPDDWQGFPQRKDYPLGGIPVEYKGAQIPAPDQRRSYS